MPANKEKKMKTGLMLLFALLLALPALAQDIGSVSGTVITEEGLSVEGADVIIRNDDRQSFNTQTNREGAFAFEDVPIGVWTIRASMENMEPAEEPIEVAANENTSIDLVLGDGGGGGGDERVGSVTGIIFTNQREPAANAFVIMLNDRRENLQTMANGRGEFSFEMIPEGAYFIQALKDGYGSIEDNLVVVNNEETVIELVLDGGPVNENGFGSVVGHVFSENGRPMIDVEVILAGERHNNHQVRTDEQGGFAFERVPANMYNIMSAHVNEGPAIENVQAIADEEVEINLVLGMGRGGAGEDLNPGFIMGSVCDDVGEPVVNAEVLLAGGGGFLFRAKTDIQGCFSIDQVPGGAYHVTAVRYEFGLAEEDVRIISRERTEVTLVLGGDSGYNNVIENPENNIPINSALLSSYPNPFNPVATVGYDLAEAGLIELSVFNSAGKQIQTLVKSFQTAGAHQISFNGQSLPAGTYILRLETAGQAQMQKVLLLK